MENSPEKKANRRTTRRAILISRFIYGMVGKRWLAGMGLGFLLVGLGFSAALLDLYRAFPGSAVLSILSMSFLPRLVRIAVLLAAGGTLFAVSYWQIRKELQSTHVRAEQQSTEGRAGYNRRTETPQVVAVGGGTGLSTLLRGMKEKTCDLTAVVTVADDGGSSGRLRRSLGIPPPGDLRNCLAALAEDESLLTQLFQYRFAEGDGIHGHSFGNLFVSALAGVTGNFERGLIEAGHVLSIRGRVIPSTLNNITLEGELVGDRANTLRRVSGESQIQSVPGAIWRVWIEPEDVRAYPGAVQAILNADMVILGPGSLFTSVLPNLLIREIREALDASRALKVYVCNLTTQPGETDGYSVRDHLDAIERHISPLPVQVVLVNTARPMELPEDMQWVETEAPEGSIQMVCLDLADEHNTGHHDPQKLAAALVGLLERRAELLNA
jgi:uncharacterized cofD-like protein